LSESVAAAVPEAVAAIEEVVARLVTDAKVG
jgi:hypothetical protein